MSICARKDAESMVLVRHEMFFCARAHKRRPSTDSLLSRKCASGKCSEHIDHVLFFLVGVCPVHFVEVVVQLVEVVPLCEDLREV